MISRRMILVTAVSGILAAVALPGGRTSAGQDAAQMPLLTDLAQLNLEVSEVQVADEIRDYLISANRLSAGQSQRLVTVTLKGRAVEAYRVAIDVREFAAVYDRGVGYGGLPGTEVTLSKAAWVHKPLWCLPTERTGSWTQIAVVEPGPVVLGFAVVLPDDVTRFHVRYPTAAKGTAALPSG